MKIRVMPHNIVVTRRYNELDLKLALADILPHQFCKVLKSNDGKELADYLIKLEAGGVMNSLHLFFKNIRGKIYGRYTDRFKNKWISCYIN